MSKLADIIEAFILRKLSVEQNDSLVLQRNEMAVEIECAPSQISYVLSTRFTLERGFIVHSRRGSGGFIRIARIPMQRIEYEEAAEQIVEDTSLSDAKVIIEHLRMRGLVSTREAALMLHFFIIIYERVDREDRVTMLRSLLLNLDKHS